MTLFPNEAGLNYIQRPMALHRKYIMVFKTLDYKHTTVYDIIPNWSWFKL